ncbi:MAG: hypothetical protein NT149_04560 [Candidatus Gottesmanbacteria bacterium]|nr:hypothetical protein [Candidatus Gottesmanbacteria bacterium]
MDCVLSAVLFKIALPDAFSNTVKLAGYKRENPQNVSLYVCVITPGVGVGLGRDTGRGVCFVSFLPILTPTKSAAHMARTITSR